VLISITLVNISQLDLNLLHVLHAVLAERSATRAAKRLHVTQSAVSNALARLRQALGDPLLVRSARGLSPTPRARELEPELARIMSSLQALVSGGQAFDAATTTREFTVACADYCTAVIGPPLCELLRRRAPAAKLRFVPLEQLMSTEGLARDIDLHLGMPSKVPPGCSSLALFDDSFVCLLPARARPGARRLSLPAYLAAQHVRVSVLSSTRDAIDVALAKRGLSRNVVLTVPHFSVVPLMVERGGYVATLSRRLVESQVQNHALTWREPPISLGKRATRMIWHERTDRDPGAQFLRELVREATG
jgi:DNA-binding transcriptional LysR family regulator